MPLTEAFRKYASDPRFWADFRGENLTTPGGDDPPRPDLDAAPVDLMLDVGTGLRVWFEYGGSTTILVPGRRVVAGGDQPGRRPPHAPRPSVAGGRPDRAWRADRPRVAPPGVPFLLLQPFVVSLDVANHATKYPLTAAAWRSLGAVLGTRIVGMARGRPIISGFVWAPRGGRVGR